MAKVKVLKDKGLVHEFSVTVPKESLEAQKQKRLAEIAKTAKMPGFRPGKVPLKVVEQHHGHEAHADAVQKTASEAINEILTERKLRAALQPKVEWVAMDEGKDLEFKMEVEVLPQVEVHDFGALSLERPVADVEDSKVDQTITSFAKRMQKPDVVTEPRGAKMGDIVVINFDGSVDGKKQPGMKGENHPLELGSHSFIDTFEDQLVGGKVGDKKTINVTFPKDYHASDLAGKKAVFEVEVKELRQPKAVELNDALAKDMGFPGIDKLRERVRDDIGADYKRIGHTVIKRKLMDQLDKDYTFDVPPGLVDAEFGGIWKQVEAAKAKGDLPEEDRKKNDKQLREEYLKIAQRRIRLGLLLAEIAQQNKIEVTSDELRNALMAEARRFPGQEKAVFDYYTKTQGALERLRAPLLEEKVVDFIISKAKVTEKKISAEELLKLPEEE